MTAADRQRLRQARDEAKRREIAEAHGRLAAEAAQIRGDWADAAPYESRKPRSPHCSGCGADLDAAAIGCKLCHDRRRRRARRAQGHA